MAKPPNKTHAPHAAQPPRPPPEPVHEPPPGKPEPPSPPKPPPQPTPMALTPAARIAAMSLTHTYPRAVATPLAATDPSTLGLSQLRDTVAVQQRSIHFMLANSDALTDQVNAFGKPVVLALNAAIPSGFWRCVLPLTGTVAIQLIAGVSVLLSAPGPFASDGSATVSYAGGITLMRSTPPPTPLP